MLQRLRAVACVAVLGLTGATSVPLAAHATPLTRLTVIDDRGDMWKRLGRGDEATRAPHQRVGDINRTTITHAERAVIVRMRLTEVRRTLPMWAADVRLRTNANVFRQVTLTVGRSMGGVRGTIEVRGRREVIDCTVDHSIDTNANAADVVRLRIPRSCLDAARWVQASVVSAGVWGRNSAIYFDGAHGAQQRVNIWTRRIHLSEPRGEQTP